VVTLSFFLVVVVVVVVMVVVMGGGLLKIVGIQFLSKIRVIIRLVC